MTPEQHLKDKIADIVFEAMQDHLINATAFKASTTYQAILNEATDKILSLIPSHKPEPNY